MNDLIFSIRFKLFKLFYMTFTVLIKIYRNIGIVFLRLSLICMFDFSLAFNVTEKIKEKAKRIQEITSNLTIV